MVKPIRSANYAVKLIGLDGDESGILAFIGDDHASVCAFINDLVEAMFPPMSRGSSLLSAQTIEGGLLLFEARGGGSVVTIRIPNCPAAIGRFIRSTLKSHGSIPIIFGVATDENVEHLSLISPADNYFVKTEAFIDDAFVTGAGRKDWRDELTLLESEIAVSPMIAPANGSEK